MLMRNIEENFPESLTALRTPAKELEQANSREEEKIFISSVLNS